MITPQEAKEKHEIRSAMAHEAHIKLICGNLDQRLIDNYHIISKGEHRFNLTHALVTQRDADEILPKYRELGWNIDFKNGNFIIGGEGGI
jgi:hypothetical protein